jgi:hypothetical protein
MFPCIYYPKLEKHACNSELLQHLFIGRRRFSLLGPGFLLRQGQLQKNVKQIIELEKEMLRNHAEIIDLHRQIESHQKSTVKNRRHNS